MAKEQPWVIAVDEVVQCYGETWTICMTPQKQEEKWRRCRVTGKTTRRERWVFRWTLEGPTTLLTLGGHASIWVGGCYTLNTTYWDQFRPLISRLRAPGAKVEMTTCMLKFTPNCDVIRGGDGATVAAKFPMCVTHTLTRQRRLTSKRVLVYACCADPDCV
jgi:hypothetical protein